MEVGQADQVAAQKQLYMSKWYSHSLASTKVVYARDEDPSDTIIIRSLYPKIEEHKKLFGLKDLAHIRTLFLSLLMLFKLEMKSMQQRVRYVKKEDFQETHKAIMEMSESISELGTEISENDNYTSMRFYTGSNYVNVKVSSKSEFPFIILCNEDEDKRYTNSTNLFIGEGITLLKYLNSRFGFTYTDVLKLKDTRNVEVFRNDSFF